MEDLKFIVEGQKTWNHAALDEHVQQLMDQNNDTTETTIEKTNKSFVSITALDPLIIDLK